MEAIKDIAGRVSELKGLRWLANRAFPDGSTIKCDGCNAQRPCTTSEIVEWMQTGFPRCRKCGVRTILVNPWRRG